MSSRIIFGIHGVEELCRARPREVSVVYVAEGKRNEDINRVVVVARDRGIAVETRPRQLIADLADSKAHQGMVAIAGAYGYVQPEDILKLAHEAGEPALIVILDGITDPQNLGAIVRSAEVLGAHGIIVPEKETAPVATGAVKASAGATERVQIAQVANLLPAIDKLREQGLTVWGTTAGDGTRLSQADLTVATALVIGSEGRGLREAVARRCNGVLSIPMRGKVASLNASAAGAILLYEALRQRGTVEAQSE